MALFESIQFRRFGPIQDATLKLNRLHALIGPNDSGKSMTLKGIQFASTWSPYTNPATQFAGFMRVVTSSCTAVLENGRLAFLDGRGNEQRDRIDWPQARMLRLDPDFLRHATALIRDDQPLDFADDRGSGLGSILDAINARNVDQFLDLRAQTRKLFPTFDGFHLATTQQGRSVGARLKNGTTIGPAQMSEGLLYFLAFSVLPLIRPTGLLLVEEPENGLHPARIGEVMKVLRAISATTQVIVATHSPLVINELEPDEVTLVRRTPEEGTTFTPMTATPNFERRRKAFALGELWLNYADGQNDDLAPKEP